LKALKKEQVMDAEVPLTAIFSKMQLFSDYRIKGSMTDMIEPFKNEVQKSIENDYTFN